MGDGPYRQGGESCASCVELARDNGELRAARKARTRTTWAQALGGAAVVSAMVSGSGMLASWIHGCASAPSAAEVCKDSAEIVSVATTIRRCDPGATVFTEEIGGNVLVRCVCAGAPVGPHAEASEPTGAR